MRKRQLEVNGIHLMLTEFSQEGEPLLLLHPGGVFASFVWHEIAPFFQDHYHVFAFDLRGHGESQAPPHGYSMEAQTSDILAVLDQLGIEKTHIVGNSLGGDIATHFAAQYPERMLSLVNIDSGIINFTGENGEVSDAKEVILHNRAQRQVPVYASPEEFVEQATAEWVPLDKPSAAVIQHKILRPAPGGGLTYVQLPDIGVQVMDMVCDMRFETCYPQITCPVLFLPAAKEDNFDRKLQLIEQHQKHLSHSKTAVIPESEHIPMLDLAQEYAEVILAFLDEVTKAQKNLAR
ncbi:2-succinyl-6-hydroxy-2,4-cyclohexadiene-1-carboxylate synthase [Tumebacillus sp. BK434]|uniref:alpha/beta fold hydrolase n=1 Tax=Tumebacillus sp. BK434 TaxID=2512169 RepID=UPI001050CB39|nr:alpha/beta hydrolase [Tumebacillus sp. BK434]TCP59427.1 2-succinyl-6-hydroxy-2,4-cyclohexadiene-1-carboxylate synthase [Tumebacillus sp. BK434]